MKNVIVNENGFFQKAKNNIIKFQKIISALSNQNKSLGFYMPLRAIPYHLIIPFLYDSFKKSFETLKYPVENGMMKHIEIPYHRKGTKIL